MDAKSSRFAAVWVLVLRPLTLHAGGAGGLKGALVENRQHRVGSRHCLTPTERYRKSFVGRKMFVRKIVRKKSDVRARVRVHCCGAEMDCSRQGPGALQGERGGDTTEGVS